ncbi:cobalt ABC transporter ATP-binding protein [Lactococcus chungangensis CAU 28 = DSM 22330]|uniref:Cobalt ABC transporter ATP-binding protein n=1 Tax=Pseudolactococcus chungangensis CAU 28 = DSM 22330 TaxID=1122154 RepID=A0A1K2HID0_9LACT|nr:energy-coupling factor ABC transporter ATP-binding protein [Lactococcus chungangensis]PCS02176.1 cobalt ABC transporter ATP-binding protein [Lactococcus chungangensis CAU 28 = DSM 22330]SFZ76257.1 energy-coupling factor transport system ATP-binding protein [Lactococcus chungangensis CAU 28 = DSM 22330]
MQKILEIKNLTYQYEESSDIYAVNDVSFDVVRGEWVSIIGRNGSGKSTTARLIDGLMAAASGEIIIDGQTLTEKNVWELRQKVGMVFQNPDNQFVGSTVEDDVAFGMENHGVPREEMLARVNAALERVNMQEFKTKEPARLSGGQKQRVAIAGIVALRPDIIILDEATSMLDPKGRLEIIQVVREIKEQYGLTVISITHDLDEASLSDKIIVMRDGKIEQIATPDDLFLNHNLVDIGLDVPFSANVARELRQNGLQIPEKYYTESELADFLWQSLLTK